MGRIKLTKANPKSVFRKIAMGTWRTVGDPTVYGRLDIDMTEALKAAKEYGEKHGVKVTPTHMVGRAVSICMEKRPEINGMIRGSRIYYRENVSLFYQVNIPGDKKNKVKNASLSGVTIHQAEKKSVLDIINEINAKVELVRSNKDPELSKNIALFRLIPWWFCRFYLTFISWIVYGLNLDLTKFGVPKDPFGSIMITNIGGLGIDLAWAPLVPYSRVPILIAIGAIKPTPWAISETEFEVRPIMSLGVTFDHRLIDGVHASQMAKDFKECFANPRELLFAE